MVYGKFDIILTDVPWTYEDGKSDISALGGVSYPKMTTEDLCKLPVKDIAAKDCLLFFWATHPKMEEAFQIIRAWGFKPTTTAFVWVKLNPKATYRLERLKRRKMVKEHPDYPENWVPYGTPRDVITVDGGFKSGLGSWTNGNTEFVILAKRGRPKRISKSVKQLIFAPVSKHSKKPAETYNRISSLVGSDKTKLEMFATSKVEGWTSIGLDVTGNDIRDDLQKLIRGFNDESRSQGHT